VLASVIEVCGALQTKYKMAKNLFLNRERAIPSAQVPFVRREEPDTEIASSSSRNTSVAETTVQLPFRILDETSLFQNLTRPGEACLLSLKIRAKSKNL